DPLTLREGQAHTRTPSTGRLEDAGDNEPTSRDEPVRDGQNGSKRLALVGGVFQIWDRGLDRPWTRHEIDVEGRVGEKSMRHHRRQALADLDRGGVIGEWLELHAPTKSLTDEQQHEEGDRDETEHA